MSLLLTVVCFVSAPNPIRVYEHVTTALVTNQGINTFGDADGSTINAPKGVSCMAGPESLMKEMVETVRKINLDRIKGNHK